MSEAGSKMAYCTCRRPDAGVHLKEEPVASFGQRSGDRGSEDEDLEDHAGVLRRAGVRVPAPDPEPPPVREPIDLAIVDEADAIAIAQAAIQAAGRILDVDTFRFEEIVAQVVPQVRDGRAAAGLVLHELCAKARVGRGRVGQHYRPEWIRAAALAVRIIVAAGGRRVLYEELHTMPARTRRDHQGFATHHHKQAAHAVHFAGVALGASDRHTCAHAIPLTTGTRDDSSADVADVERIEGFAAELGHVVPGPVADHLHHLLVFERDLRSAVHQASDRLDDALRPLGLDGRTLALNGFARLLLLDAMPFGPPTSRTRASSGIAYPGRDPDVLRVLGVAGRPAIAFVGDFDVPSGVARVEGELEARGFVTVPWEGGELSDALGTPRTQPYGVEVLWSEDEAALVRREVVGGARAQKWVLTGTATDDLAAAIAIIERTRAGWPRELLRRSAEACGPGFLKSQNIASQAAWRALLLVADAALVDADRQQRVRQAGG